MSDKAMTDKAMSDKVSKGCGVCNRKLPLTAFPCRCEKRFCSIHRSDIAHSCPFDYKKEGQQLLSTLLVKVESEKVSII